MPAVRFVAVESVIAASKGQAAAPHLIARLWRWIEEWVRRR
jgi:hypothetical protein